MGPGHGAENGPYRRISTSNLIRYTNFKPKLREMLPASKKNSNFS